MAKQKQVKYKNMIDLALQGMNPKNSFAHRQAVYAEQNRLNEIQRAADEEKARKEAEEAEAAEESSEDVL